MPGSSTAATSSTERDNAGVLFVTGGQLLGVGKRAALCKRSVGSCCGQTPQMGSIRTPHADLSWRCRLVIYQYMCVSNIMACIDPVPSNHLRLLRRGVQLTGDIHFWTVGLQVQSSLLA